MITKADSEANDLIRETMQKAKYLYVWFKLQNARMYLLRTHSWETGKESQ